MTGRFERALLTVMLDLAVLGAILLTARLVVEFFGAMAAGPVGTLVVRLSDHLILPLGLAGRKTPYGGIFNMDATATVLLLLVVQPVLSRARGDA